MSLVFRNKLFHKKLFLFVSIVFTFLLNEKLKNNFQMDIKIKVQVNERLDSSYQSIERSFKMKTQNIVILYICIDITESQPMVRMFS